MIGCLIEEFASGGYSSYVHTRAWMRESWLLSESVMVVLAHKKNTAVSSQELIPLVLICAPIETRSEKPTNDLPSVRAKTHRFA